MTVAGFKALVAVGFGVRLNKKQAAEVAASIAGLEPESSSLRRQIEEAKAEIESLRHAATDEGLAAREMVRAAERERDEAREALSAEQKRHRRTALMSSAFVGALLSHAVVTIGRSDLLAARLRRVEERPDGGVRFTETDRTLAEELAARSSQEREGA